MTSVTVSVTPTAAAPTTAGSADSSGNNISTVAAGKSANANTEATQAVEAKGAKRPNAAALFALLLATHRPAAAQTAAVSTPKGESVDGKDAGKDVHADGQSLPQQGDTLPLAALVLVAGLPPGAAQAVRQAAAGKDTAQTGEIKLPAGLRRASELTAQNTDTHVAAASPNHKDDGHAAAVADTVKADAAATASQRSAQVAQSHGQATALLDATQAASAASGHGVDTSAQAQHVGLAAVHAAAAGAKAADVKPNLPVLHLQQPMHQPGWNNELGSRIVWMTKNDLQGAELRLNPPHLGPLEVKISIHHDSANLNFVAHHVQARDAIEAALPRLREMMAEQGFAKTHVDVSGQSLAQNQHQSAPNPGQGAAPFSQDLLGEDDSMSEHLLGPTQHGLGMVDYFV